ncbi:copper fist DNA binding domain-containing protein [Suillus subalutaceus]|uniref:copper fist DNA binding domain-containing protein n=1 Tax=Suillus subalutaceus TaxID=48586 RepID=UPI001B87862C|nr:copper fist DNA binding domain-containing protein [Suillus subalutaceus]KAG1865542.1 copper fist DNA binding domain-containing protein [Suillus subalutaceus]
MVHINDKKFACESCIKGHRSSSCHHSERPLFEVKKKGRPVSQCKTCRELRNSKRFHSKCTCNPREVVDKIPIPAARPDRKPKRFMPTVPTLPNGISDALSTSSSSQLTNRRQTVDSLLNPCHCKNVWQCLGSCRSMPLRSSPAPATESSPNGLAMLAKAAALIREDVVSCPTTQCSEKSSVSSKSCCIKDAQTAVVPSVRFDLPPVYIDTLMSTPPSSSMTVPEFPTIPPFSAFNSIAGSGCTCGLQCACPGCVKHRGPVHALKEHKDCAEGCNHCVDHSAGVELPALGQGASGNSMIDQFFARAASLPIPPVNRKVGVEFDPTDITIYPVDLFTKSVKEYEVRGAAFGLVTVPKLECCGGRCGCPSDDCGCGQSCDGCPDGQHVHNRSEPVS